MNVFTHLGHLFHFDGLLHWCFLIAVSGFMIGLLWVVVRILLPLRRLAKQATSIMEGGLPDFDLSSGGIHEIEQLRRSLQYMMEQVKAAQEREIAYRNALTESQENERLRIAREIHDDTIQSLVLVAHNIERAAQSAETHENEVAAHLQNARSQLLLAIEELRQVIADLRPTVLDELGLVIAIEMLCEKHPALEFSVRGQVYEIAASQELAIFRAAQEAIHNAERHAHANGIWVTLTYTDSAVLLDVRDDGVGFNVPQQLQELAANGHFGLLGIRERMVQLGGSFRVSSETQHGTHLRAMVPSHLLLATA